MRKLVPRLGCVIAVGVLAVAGTLIDYGEEFLVYAVVAIAASFILGRLVGGWLAPVVGGLTALAVIPASWFWVYFAYAALSGNYDAGTGDDEWWATLIIIAFRVFLPVFFVGAAFGWLGGSLRVKNDGAGITSG